MDPNIIAFPGKPMGLLPSHSRHIFNLFARFVVGIAEKMQKRRKKSLKDFARIENLLIFALA